MIAATLDVTVLYSQLRTSLSNDWPGGGVWLKVRATTKAHHVLHLLISCLTYTSSTAEGSRESNKKKKTTKNQSQVRSRGERDMLIRCYSNQSWQTHTHTHLLWHTQKVIGQDVDCVYLSLRCHWLCSLWPTAGSAGIRSRRLWRPGAAAALIFLPVEESRAHWLSTHSVSLPGQWISRRNCNVTCSVLFKTRVFYHLYLPADGVCMWSACWRLMKHVWELPESHGRSWDSCKNHDVWSCWCI